MVAYLAGGFGENPDGALFHITGTRVAGCGSSPAKQNDEQFVSASQ